MDTVKGKQGVTKSCMLVLTERKTRDEIIFKLKDQKAESVVDALDRLERKWGDMFSKVFRSITVDNGVEFSDCKGMERSALTPGEKRTYLFYCHREICDDSAKHSVSLENTWNSIPSV